MAEKEDISNRLKGVTLADVTVTTVEHRDGISQDGTLRNTEKDAQKPHASTISSKASLCLQPDPQFLPLTACKAYCIANTRTFFHVQVFRDRTMLTCSQISDGRIATWLLCKPITSAAVPAYPGRQIDLDVMPLLGARDADVVFNTVLAKQIYASIAGTAPAASNITPLLLGLGLPKMEIGSNRELFHTIAHLMSQLYRQTVTGVAC